MEHAAVANARGRIQLGETYYKTKESELRAQRVKEHELLEERTELDFLQSRKRLIAG
ncbi:MAG: hypothetical protein ABIP95_13840 [Pelobium sp.]